MSEHTPEPWLQGSECLTLIHKQTGESIAGANTAADARRIVACVNACAGISNEALEAAAIRSGIVKPDE